MYDGEWQENGSGSGTEFGYRVEVRCKHAFVAWNLEHYKCAAFPKGEFVIDQDWRSIPVVDVPPPLGMIERGLPFSHFTVQDNLMCYEAARALQQVMLAQFKNKPFVELRITQVEYTYTHKSRYRSAAPIRTCVGSGQFIPAGLNEADQ